MLIHEKLHQPLYTMSLPALEHNLDDIKIQGELENFYNTPLTSVPKISEKMQAKLMRLMGSHLRAALFHLPVGAVNRQIVPVIDPELHLSEIISFEATVKKHIYSQKKGAPDRVIMSVQTHQGSAELHLIYFRSHGDMLRHMLPVGSQRLISGKLEMFDTMLQIVHPDYVVTPDKKGDLPEIQPLYGLTAGITQRFLGGIMRDLAQQIPETAEWIQPNMLERFGWVSHASSLKRLHMPEASKDCDPQSPYRRRLAYDRILAHQMNLGLMRQKRQSAPKRPFKVSGHLAQKLSEALPFSLTGDQQKTLEDIQVDLKQGDVMSRLVQGDVGSGKTLVALFAASYVIEEGAQAALMAPTEILAKQHYASLKPLCDQVGIEVGLLTGKDKAKDVRATLKKLETGEIHLLIGTHALIQDRVIFKNLGLGIIDEQHRFGVEQRHKLGQKGDPYAHILVMTATPIPRSLAMAQYGDTDLSIIREKPPGRKPIVTKVMPADKIPAVAQGLSRVIQAGERAYWVCPLVEESEKMDLVAAEERYETLHHLYPNQVGLVHGKMKTAEKDAVVEKFAKGELSILVATTVIEVGVNVPEATVMVIEEAERFGLSQLHQLRGRVGRGDKDASCVLLYKGALSKTAQTRLTVIRSTEDGFILAEKDLELRGAGDFLGTRQTGMLDLEGFSFEFHADLIEIARDDVRHIFSTDPSLTSTRGFALQRLLRIFEGHRDIIKS